MSSVTRVDYHTFLMFGNQAPPYGIIVPQKIYRNPPLEDFRGCRPITFHERGVWGVSIARLIAGDFSGMADAETQPAMSGQARISIRVNWPGYASWAEVLDVQNRAGKPITKGRLAYGVALLIKRLLEDFRSVGSSEQGWNASLYNTSQLYLLELRHVSTGSWQPVISAIRPQHM